jgi:glycosyltransferase involved in cell wall biosynthesis
MAEFGINLVASLSGNSGLGVTARAIAGALQRHGVPFVVVDLLHPWGGKLPIEDGIALARSPADLRYPINLYVVQIVALERIFGDLPWLLAPGRFHAASLWWEASAIPPAWIENLSRFDAVLAGSGFIANVMANNLVLTPVIEVPHPLALPPGIAADRARFGLPPHATVFAVSFDPHSDAARKNPLGAIRAFRAAFPAGTEDVCLALRMHHGDTDPARATFASMYGAAGGDPRIRILIEPLDYAGVMSFYASCDAYVSLHRGEGLGLGLMESMALGKPVIATGWSGNMSFMDYRCACPVRYRTTRVAGNYPFLRPDFVGRHAHWAEPVLDDAVAWMRKLHADPELRRALGGAAKDAIAAYEVRAQDRRWIDELQALWRAQAFLPAMPGKFSATA